MQLTLLEIAEKVGGKIQGDGLIVLSGPGSVDFPIPSEVIYASNKKKFQKAIAGCCGAIITDQEYFSSPKSLLIVDNPEEVYYRLLELFEPRISREAFIHLSAIVSDSAEVSLAHISAGVVIGERVRIGRGSLISANAVIGDGVQIGDNTSVGSGVVIERDSLVGSEVIVGANVVIGSDGFGFYEDSETGLNKKIPQIGNVIIEDSVEIGSGCMIDRATAGSTVIGKNSKIDNLVHIGHNVKIGENNLIIAQTGIAGSTIIGNNCRIGGQVAIADHCVIPDGVTIRSKSAVPAGKMETNTDYWGLPIRTSRESFKIHAALKYLPALIKEWRKAK